MSDSETDKEFYHVLGILAEECSEIQQIISKIHRFGLESLRPGTEFTNKELFNQEFNDFQGTVQTLVNIKPELREMFNIDHKMVDRKEAKITMMMEISRSQGRL